jgi:hypothetical protein
MVRTIIARLNADPFQRALNKIVSITRMINPPASCPLCLMNAEPTACDKLFVGDFERSATTAPRRHFQLVGVSFHRRQCEIAL